MLGGVVGQPPKDDLLLGDRQFPRSAGRGTDRKPSGSQRPEGSDPTRHGGAMDAEEVGDVLDRVSVENALDGEESSALQFRS
jgi:hypothetical protein